MIYSTPLSYGFLFLSVLLLWMPGNRKIPLWSVALFVSILLGLISHVLEWIALIPIILLAFSAYYSQSRRAHILVRVLAGLFVVLLSIGLASHKFPGFHNLKVLDGVYLSQNATSFTFYLNFDKTMIGIFILGFGHSLISNRTEWRQLIKSLAVKGPLVILVVIAAALILGFVKFDPKIPSSILIWTLTNLLFVCMAEEAFFRGFVQKYLMVFMRKKRHGHYAALFIAAVIFGLAHYEGGIQLMILATVAGIGYGWVYIATQRIEASILTHFGLNLTHFIFFTFPALASAA